MGKGLAGK